MTALVIIETVAIALLAVLVAGLLRSHAEILRKLHDLGAGLDGDSSHRLARPVATGVAEPRIAAEGPAVDVTGELASGGSSTVAVTGVEHFTLLAFLSSGCSTCAGFWDEFRSRADLDLPGSNTRMVIVTKGSEAESPAIVDQIAPAQYVTIMSSEAWEAYQVPVSPYFIMVDGMTGEVVGEGAATTWGQVDSLLRQAMADAGVVERRTRRNGRDREARADAALAAAGIDPGHPSLYPGAAPEASD